VAIRRRDGLSRGRASRSGIQRSSTSIAISSTAQAAATDQTEPRCTVNSAQSGAASQCATWAMYARQSESSQFRGSTGSSGSCPAIPVSIPSHIAGATAGAARTFAGRAAGENWSNAEAISGAVATVAEMVTAIASASAWRAERRSESPDSAVASRFAQSMIPITAAKLSCQPTSPWALGLTASVTPAASRTAYQRARGRSASAAIRPAAPITPARWIDGPAPVTGT
jgi:hypothetical protein